MPAQHPAAGRLPARTSIPSLCFASVGLAISIYLTVEHYSGSTALACPENAAINCAKVTTSSWSRLGGIPVAVLGVAYFAVMTLLVLPSAWRRHRLDPVRVAGAAAGMAMVIYLLWAELFRVGAICLWCTAVHVCTLGLFVTILWHTAARSTATGDCRFTESSRS
jgi:uncharacterized membrane protein